MGKSVVVLKVGEKTKRNTYPAFVKIDNGSIFDGPAGSTFFNAEVEVGQRIDLEGMKVIISERTYTHEDSGEVRKAKTFTFVSQDTEVC